MKLCPRLQVLMLYGRAARLNQGQWAHECGVSREAARQAQTALNWSLAEAQWAFQQSSPPFVGPNPNFEADGYLLIKKGRVAQVLVGIFDIVRPLVDVGN